MKTYLLICVPNEDSHLRRLVRVVIVCMKKFASLAIQNAPSDDSNQTVQMLKLIGILTGSTYPKVCFLLMAHIYPSPKYKIFWKIKHNRNAPKYM